MEYFGFASLPSEPQLNILRNIDPRDIVRLCRTSLEYRYMFRDV